MNEENGGFGRSVQFSSIAKRDRDRAEFRANSESKHQRDRARRDRGKPQHRVTAFRVSGNREV